MGIAMAIAGGVMNFMGTMMGASAQASQSRYAAAVARNNAIIAEQNAIRSISVGESQAAAKGLEGASLLGKQKVAQAASGIDVGVGTAVSARQSTAELGRLDQLMIMNDAQQRAYNFRAQKMNYEAEAQLRDMQASYAQKAGIIGGIGTLIGTASSVSDKWMGYQRAGIY